MGLIKRIKRLFKWMFSNNTISINDLETNISLLTNVGLRSIKKVKCVIERSISSDVYIHYPTINFLESGCTMDIDKLKNGYRERDRDSFMENRYDQKDYLRVYLNFNLSDIATLNVTYRYVKWSKELCKYHIRIDRIGIFNNQTKKIEYYSLKRFGFMTIQATENVPIEVVEERFRRDLFCRI